MRIPHRCPTSLSPKPRPIRHNYGQANLLYFLRTEAWVRNSRKFSLRKRRNYNIYVSHAIISHGTYAHAQIYVLLQTVVIICIRTSRSTGEIITPGKPFDILSNGAKYSIREYASIFLFNDREAVRDSRPVIMVDKER